MDYELWIKTEIYRNDDGELERKKKEFYLVAETEEENNKFHEHMADEQGYQDYNFEVDFKRIGIFDEQALLKLIQLIQNRLALEELEKGIEKEKKCYNCGKMTTEKMYYWYHADQDDLVCKECAKELKHTDTCYAGSLVLKNEN